MIIQIIITMIGMTIFIANLPYNKEKHKRFAEDASLSTGSDSIIATIIGFVIVFLLSIGPWWLTKILFLLIGAGLVCIGIFLV